MHVMSIWIQALGLLMSGLPLAVVARAGTLPPPTAIPPGTEFACPMDKHPDQQDPAEQGAYFAAEAGDCPWCGMKLEPLDALPWARALQAAQGADVAYACPEHAAVFATAPGRCPRCERALAPFKVMYTCPDPAHADVIQLSPGRCPRDGRKLVVYRGVWLSEDMAKENAPPHPGEADGAAYRCPLHPLVHSDKPGKCTICAGELRAGQAVTAGGPAEPTSPPAAGASLPADAKYACPMRICHYFSAEPGKCPSCGMAIRPIEEVEWAKALPRADTAAPGDHFTCPMHPEEHSAGPGACPVCGMQLVAKEDLPQPKSATEAIQVQVNHLMEHYLELQKRFAADRTADAAQHALGLIAAADEVARLAGQADAALPEDFVAALEKLRRAALKIKSDQLAENRVALVDLSSAMRTLIGVVRPDRTRYPTIYIYHCPMSKGDWLQDAAEKRNPYYGFQMLNCGQLQETR